MANPYVTGAAHIYIGYPGNSTQPSYLGTCERSPRIALRRYYSPVFNSLRGSAVALDRIYQGENALLQLPALTRFNEGKYTGLAAQPKTSLQNLNPVTGTKDGSCNVVDIGTAMFTEGYGLIIWVQFPYYTKAVYAANGMPPGYRFLASTLDLDDLDNLNTEARRTSLLFQCDALLLGTPSTGLFWTTYDHNMTGVPLTPPD